MPYDVVAANRQAVQSGLALGRAMFDNSLRMQQLQSQQALQRLREQQMAQELAIELKKHEIALQDRADQQKAAAAFQLYQTPILPMPTGTGATIPMPNPMFTPDAGEAYMRAATPYTKDLGKTLLDASTLRLRQAQALDEQAMAASRGQHRPLSPEDAALRQAQTELARARTTQVQKGATYAPTDTQKNLRALAEAEAANDKNAIAALRRQLKLDGLTETEMVKFRSELRALDINLLMDPAEKEQRREAIYRKYDKGAAQAPPTTAAPPTDDEKVIVIDPQGRKGRIPRSQLERALKQGYKEFEG